MEGSPGREAGAGVRLGLTVFRMNTDAPARSAPKRETLSVVEAGRRLGLGKDAAYRAARSGELPVLRIGRRLLVPKARFERLLAGDESTGGEAGSP
jgi:excisionase family DNA binding protein